VEDAVKTFVDATVLDQVSIQVERREICALVERNSSGKTILLLGRKDIIQVMEAVGLDPKSKMHVRKYSMVMCQRLRIAQARMESPDIILLDEAMNGLNEQGVEDMRLLFRNLKEQGKTIVLATHVKEDVELLCDCIYQLRDGRVPVY
jgi:ABC-2 type transport system ATP-binding protein